ncbi:hypothetical protein [Tunturiibacter gelidiferens]|uniref:hypothetical protein n=1 Tax=Tunturiibacter gelidiferens TaxID=3069689 RepID=UPI003D9AFBDE
MSPRNAEGHRNRQSSLERHTAGWISFPRDRVDFFCFGPEKASLWTQQEDDYTVLLVEVDRTNILSNLWRTLASSMSISIGLASMQEQSREIDYAWIYRFDQQKPVESQDRLDGDDPLILNERSIYRIEHWFDHARILELLLRDEKFFVAAQQLCDSFRNHWFCLECALRPPAHRRHQHPEPDVWSMVSRIPNMETAIVQATRAVEGLLGKPGQNRTRTRDRWLREIRLPPEDTFDLAEKSYFDFYYDLFPVRNDSAHSFGSLSATLTRFDAITAQTFAHLVVKSRFDRDACADSEAQSRLSFNDALLSNIEGSGHSGMSSPVRRVLGVIFHREPDARAAEKGVRLAVSKHCKPGTT